MKDSESSETSFSFKDLLALVICVTLTTHFWGQTQSLEQENKALRNQIEANQAEMKGLERGVVISK